MRPEIKQINDKLNTLHKTLVEDNQNLYEIKKQSIDLINAIVALLSDTVEKDDLLREKRVQEERSRFDSAPLFKNTPAAYELINKHQNLFDFKFYWLKRILKTYMSWVVAITPNFEDNPEVFSNKNIGIDFVLSREKKTFYIILSHKFKLRVLELHDRLTQTQVEIFEKWLKIGEKIRNTREFGQKSKLQIHNELWQSFDYEPTNRKFYEGLASYFKQLVHYLQNEFKLELSEQEAKLFTTRLFNRLIFLWFLKKKNFLSPSQNYFQAYEDSTRYYKEKLEPLFFEVLNQEIKERKKNGVQDLETPFLNGGLFTPEEIDLYKNPNLTFPEKFFTSLFSFLNHYNFTVDEGTSEYQQVAIDPEMLGRIFESLLAEFIEETGEQARKAKGAFYTPREIVDYMCEESLITYLTDKFAKTDTEKARIQELVRMPESKFRDQDQNKRRDFKRDLPAEEIKDALLNIKILDPAVGSGAFPMGMLHLLVKVITRLDSKEEKNISKLKKQILSKALYGVDIENMAIQIARLRAWLSILVDMPENKVEPLPNFEFKFVCANTLIPLERSNKQIALFDDQDLKQKQIELINAHYDATRKKDKEKIKKEYLNLIHADKGGQLALGDTDYNQKLKSYNPFDPANSTDFYDPELMHGVKDFDILIGNPPYKFLSGKGSPVKILKKAGKYEEAEKQKKYLEYLTKLYPDSSKGCRDYYKWFIDRGRQLLSKKAIFTYITPDTWIYLKNYSDIRKILCEELNCLNIIDIGFNVFEEPVLSASIFIVNNNPSNKIIRFADLREYDRKFILTKFFELITKNLIKIEYNNGNILLFKNKIAENIYNKFQTRLEDVSKISEGEHSLNNDFSYILTNSDNEFINVIYDRKLIKYTEPEIKKLPANFVKKFSSELHSGKRIFIRKTGDSILAVPFTKDDLAIAHQNLYVVKPIKDFSFNLLLAILSSRLLNFLYQSGPNGQRGRVLAQFRIHALYNLPIPLVTPQNEYIVKQIESLVDQILEHKSQNPSADTSDLENQIDELVFGLYGLSEEEKNIILND